LLHSSSGVWTTNLETVLPETGQYTLVVGDEDGRDTGNYGIFVQRTITLQAYFTANVTGGLAPLTINFVDLSSGTPDSWNWSFGDGNYSTTQNPVHTYRQPGLYSVALTVANGTLSNSTMKPEYVNVTTPFLWASFTSNVTSGTAPLSVRFTDTSTGSPVSWEWNFGDGTPNSTLQNPVHEFQMNGRYSVILTASNEYGSGTVIGPEYITVIQSQPLASFTANTTNGTSPLTVQFIDSSYPGTGIDSWQWDFENDGIIDSTSQNPSHTYLNPGVYSIKLVVTGPGGTDDEIKTGYITVVANNSAGKVFFITPNCEQINGINFSPNVSGIYRFTAINGSYNPWPAPVSEPWLTRVFLYRDREVEWQHAGSGGELVPENPDFPLYNISDSVDIAMNEGDYVVLIAPDGISGYCGNGCQGGVYVDVTLISSNSPEHPVASFTANSTSGSIPLVVKFSDTSSGNPTSWVWNFGDGSPIAMEPNPTHEFLTDGTFSISLTVSNAAGNNTTTQTHLITVTGIPLLAGFSVNQTNGPPPLGVQFTDTSTGSPETLNWSFGDGSVSGEENPVHIYSEIGTYTVSLEITNDSQINTIRKIDLIRVENPVPVADFIATPIKGTAPLVVWFTDKSTGEIVIWNWSFGDGSSETIQNPVYIFKSPGNYQVSLTIRNGSGYESTKAATVFVYTQGLGSGGGASGGGGGYTAPEATASPTLQPTQSMTISPTTVETTIVVTASAPSIAGTPVQNSPNKPEAAEPPDKDNYQPTMPGDWVASGLHNLGTGLVTIGPIGSIALLVLVIFNSSSNALVAVGQGAMTVLETPGKSHLAELLRRILEFLGNADVERLNEKNPGRLVRFLEQDILYGFTVGELITVAISAIFLGFFLAVAYTIVEFQLIHILFNNPGNYFPQLWDNLVHNVVPEALPIFIVAGLAISAIHEIGHKTMANKYGISMKYSLWPIGMFIVAITGLLGTVFAYPARTDPVEEEQGRKYERAMIMLAGPVATLMLGFVFLGLMTFYEPKLMEECAKTSFFIAFYLLIPIKPLDGKAIWVWKWWVSVTLVIILFLLIVAAFWFGTFHPLPVTVPPFQNFMNYIHSLLQHFRIS
jgi:PKD repeat protein/Zn-dependent protease